MNERSRAQGPAPTALPNAAIILAAEHGPGRCWPVATAAQMIATERAMLADVQMQDEADAGNAALPVAREFWRHPTFAEIQRRRLDTNEPCTRRCMACSRCIRAEAALANLAAFGTADRPGVSRRAA